MRTARGDNQPVTYRTAAEYGDGKSWIGKEGVRNDLKLATPSERRVRVYELTGYMLSSIVLHA